MYIQKKKVENGIWGYEKDKDNWDLFIFFLFLHRKKKKGKGYTKNTKKNPKYTHLKKYPKKFISKQ